MTSRIRLATDAMLVIAERPDCDPQCVLAFGECGNGGFAISQAANDLGGGKRDMPQAPLDQKVRRMVGDFRDVAAKVDSGDACRAARSFRRPVIPKAATGPRDPSRRSAQRPPAGP